MSPAFSLDELVAHARNHCPFYRVSLAGVPDKPRLTDLPVLDRVAYWDAHQRDRQEVLTAPLSNGIVVSSGGTTGVPKLAYHDYGDWDRGIVTTAMGFERLGLSEGHRVANLFAAGEMYGSFLGTTSSLKVMRGVRVLQLPLSGSAHNRNIVDWMRRFEVNVLASGPTRLLSLIDYIEKAGINDLLVDRLLFAGESFFPAQRAVAERVFPGVKIQSTGYASVDAGMMGYADEDSALDEHRTLSFSGLMEILDPETHEPIITSGPQGYIVFTSLIRRFQPVIRYPSGDLGQWLEDARPDPCGAPADGTRYLLLGRSHQGFRMAFQSFELADFERILVPFVSRYGVRQSQVLVESLDGRERMTLRLVGNVAPANASDAAEDVIGAFYDSYNEKPHLRKLVADRSIWPPIVDWITPDELLVNERTGKLRTVVDLRRG